MKKTVVTNVKIKDNDYDLLKIRIPEDPCINCINRYACCGCSKKKEVNAVIRSLKDAGIFEAQQKVQEVKELQLKLKEMEQTIATNKEYLTDNGFDLDRIFGDDGNIEVRRSGAFIVY